MHLPHHQQMLRDHKKHGGVDAVMTIIAKENPGALRPEAIQEIREKHRLVEKLDAFAAVA